METKPNCSKEGCEHPVKAHDVCTAHYKRLVRSGYLHLPVEEVKRKERDVNLWLWRKIRLEDFEQMFEEQGKVCAICGTDAHGGLNWQMDHDHNCCPVGKSCGKCNRGILCRSCNVTLTKTLELPGWWDSAQAYLAKYN